MKLLFQHVTSNLQRKALKIHKIGKQFSFLTTLALSSFSFAGDCFYTEYRRCIRHLMLSAWGRRSKGGARYVIMAGR